MPKKHLFTLTTHDGMIEYDWWQEEPRTRTVLNQGSLVKIKTSWIQYAYVTNKNPKSFARLSGLHVRTANIVDTPTKSLRVFMSEVPITSPDDAVSAIQLPNTNPTSWCMGSGTAMLGKMDLAEIFWMTDFTDYNIKARPVSAAKRHVTLYELPYLPSDHPASQNRRVLGTRLLIETPANLIAAMETSLVATATIGAWRKSPQHQKIRAEQQRQYDEAVAKHKLVLAAAEQRMLEKEKMRQARIDAAKKANVAKRNKQELNFRYRWHQENQPVSPRKR